MKMSAPRSRRVQAQRKFAQGAYVPPNAAAVAAVDNRRDAAQDARNVTINNMTATSLLDVVSLQGLHTHSQPVVVVERLRATNTTKEVANNEKNISPPASLKTCNNNDERALVSEVVAKAKELVMDEAEDAFSDAESMQLFFFESSDSLSLKSDDLNNENAATNKDLDDKIENAPTCLPQKQLELLNLTPPKNNNKEIQYKEKQNSNKGITCNVKETCVKGKEFNEGKEPSTKDKTKTRRRANTKVNTKEKGNTKGRSSSKGKGIGKGCSNRGKQSSINEEHSLASVARSMQRMTDKNAQKTHVMSLRKRRLSNGKVSAATARKLLALKDKNGTMNKKTSRPQSSSDFSVDDNRPLTYYAQNNKTKKKSPKKRRQICDLFPDTLTERSYPKRIILESSVPPPQPTDLINSLKRTQSLPSEPVAGPNKK